MDAKMKMRRFCFIGSLEPVFSKFRGYIDVHYYWPKLNALCKQLNYQDMHQILKDALLGGRLVRYDEPIFAYAAYISADLNVDWKTKLRQEFPKLVTSDRELFLFVYYVKRILKELGKDVFGRTIKKAIVAWYNYHSADGDKFLWTKNRGYYGYTHKNIIKKFHISDKVFVHNEAATRFFQTATAFARTGLTLENDEQETDKANPSNTDNDKSEASDDDEKSNKYSDTKNTVDTRKCISKLPTTAAAGMDRLKTTKNKFEALKIIKKFDFTFDQVPNTILNYNMILLHFIPKMPYEEILKRWRKMAKNRQFESTKILKLCQSILEDKEKMQEANLHPIIFLFQLYNCGGRMNLLKLPVTRVEQMKLTVLRDVYLSSFGQNKPTGLRMHITMNLQNNYRIKFLKNYKTLSFFEAVVAFAFGYFSAEEKVDVFHWIECNTTVKQIKWNKEMDLEKAIDLCVEVSNPKNQQRLVAPIVQALQSGELYDVFLVLVPTAGRGNPGQKPDFLWKFLDRYRTLMSLDTKFIILDVIKTKKSMIYSEQLSQNILEICGLDEFTPQIINNFVSNRFY